MKNCLLLSKKKLKQGDRNREKKKKKGMVALNLLIDLSAPIHPT